MPGSAQTLRIFRPILPVVQIAMIFVVALPLAVTPATGSAQIPGIRDLAPRHPDGYYVPVTFPSATLERMQRGPVTLTELFREGLEVGTTVQQEDQVVLHVTHLKEGSIASTYTSEPVRITDGKITDPKLLESANLAAGRVSGVQNVRKDQRPSIRPARMEGSASATACIAPERSPMLRGIDWSRQEALYVSVARPRGGVGDCDEVGAEAMLILFEPAR